MRPFHEAKHVSLELACQELAVDDMLPSGPDLRSEVILLLRARARPFCSLTNAWTLLSTLSIDATIFA